MSGGLGQFLDRWTTPEIERKVNNNAMAHFAQVSTGPTVQELDRHNCGSKVHSDPGIRMLDFHGPTIGPPVGPPKKQAQRAI